MSISYNEMKMYIVHYNHYFLLSLTTRKITHWHFPNYRLNHKHKCEVFYTYMQEIINFIGHDMTPSSNVPIGFILVLNNI